MVLAFVVAYGAKNRGRSFGLFFILSILFSPLISAFIMLVLGNKPNSSQGTYSTYSPNHRSVDQTEKKCKSCGSIISIDFRKCPNCGSYEFTDNTIDLTKVERVIKQEAEATSLKCPYCGIKFKLSISNNDFIETKCIKCKKKITLRNAIFE